MLFQEHTRDVLHQVDAKKTLTPHGNLTEKVDLLTLVKKKKKNSIFPPEYEVMSLTLGDLIPAFAGFSEFEETTLIKDYKHTGMISGSAGVRGGVDMASAGVSAGALRHRETSSVNINAKTANLRKMREICLGQKINRVHMPTLRKGEVLGFVDKIVFNTNDVPLRGRTEVDGSCEARWNIMNFSLKGKMKDSSSYTVPAGHIYGYRFNEIKFKEEEDVEFTCKSHIEYVGGKAEEQRLSPPSPIRLVEKALEPETFEPDDSTEETLETLQQVREKLLRTETVLQPLAHLPRVTRFALFQSLSVLSEDRDALTLLKKKLDQWCAGEPLEQPQSQSVCSVLHLLSGFATPPLQIGPETTDSTLEAVYLLVSAMDKLPEHVTSLIAKYRPDTLRGLNQLVSSLMENGQAHLSESLPAALQDGGQLHWLAVFLCSSDESLREPSEQTIVAGDEPGVLLLALCVAVRGLSMLRQ